MKREYLIILLAIAAASLYWIFYRDRGGLTAEFCTQEAKLCSDGSYVGRTGPNCEFAACPAAADTEWKTFIDSEKKIEFRYPEKLSTKYISAFDWPPQVQVLEKPFSCTEAGSETARAGRTERRAVENRTYCVTKITEGAAGSIYTQHAYAFEIDDKTIYLIFSTRATQCGNYGETEKSECEAERETFDLDGVVDRIAQSLRLE